jgi:hypothetical protein
MLFRRFYSSAECRRGFVGSPALFFSVPSVSVRKSLIPAAHPRGFVGSPRFFPVPSEIKNPLARERIRDLSVRQLLSSGAASVVDVSGIEGEIAPAQGSLC